LATHSALAVAAQACDRARLQGASLLHQYKDTAAAERIAAGFVEVKAKRDAARDLRRKQGLWQYNQIPGG
ncbi:hypothetical protein AAGG41_23550, partial [Stenotrophomonas maltophilia]